MCILISQCFCDKKYLIFLSNLYLIPFKKDWGLIANVFMLDLLTKKKNKTLSLSLFAARNYILCAFLCLLKKEILWKWEESVFFKDITKIFIIVNDRFALWFLLWTLLFHMSCLWFLFDVFFLIHSVIIIFNWLVSKDIINFSIEIISSIGIFPCFLEKFLFLPQRWFLSFWRSYLSISIFLIRTIVKSLKGIFVFSIAVIVFFSWHIKDVIIIKHIVHFIEIIIIYNIIFFFIILVSSRFLIPSLATLLPFTKVKNISI